MGGSTGMFGTQKQKASGGFKITKDALMGEQEAIARQRAIANGSAPSIAQMSFNQNLDMANQQAMALAASQRGASNPMLAFRQAQLGNQQMGLEGAQQGAIMAEQERRAADAFLQQTAAGQRGIALQSAMGNQQADAAKANSERQMVSGMAQGGMMALASDERAKENISPANDVAAGVADFLKNLKPSKYEYKDSKHGTGEKVGIMAQDLEKSEIGKTMVDQAPDGTKIVDTNKAIGALLAATAEMHKEIKNLKKKA